MSTSSDRPGTAPRTVPGPSATQEIPTLPPPDRAPGGEAGTRDPGTGRTGDVAGTGSTAAGAAAVTPQVARPATGGHDLPPPRAAQRPAAPAAAPSTPAAQPPAPPMAAADAPGSLAATGHAAGGPQPTGPVDFVPAPPGPPAPASPLPDTTPAATTPPAGATATAPAPAVEAATPTAATPTAANPTSGPRTAVDDPASRPGSLLADERPAARPRRRVVPPADRQALAGLSLAVVAVALLEVGLLGAFGADPFWSTVTLWSAFATLCAVLALAAFVAFYPAGNRLRSSAVWRLAAAGLVGLSVFWVLVVLPVVASDRGFVLTAALGCLGAALWIGPRRSA
jgi:hypothetical protein